MLSKQNGLIFVRLRRLGAGALFRRLCSAIEIIGRVDQGDMRKGLRKIANETFRRRVILEIIAHREQPLEQLSRVVQPSQKHEIID